MQLTVAPNGQSAMPAMPAMPAESAVSAVPRPAAVAAEKKAQQQQAKPLRRYQSVVSCGSVSGCRSRKWAVFGDESVDVYHAAEDPHRRDLVKSSCLADFFRCSKSRVAMFLSRNKVKMDGIYQATKISNNEHWQTIGVRVGGYFITQGVCESFRRHIGFPYDVHFHAAAQASQRQLKEQGKHAAPLQHPQPQHNSHKRKLDAISTNVDAPVVVVAAENTNDDDDDVEEEEVTDGGNDHVKRARFASSLGTSRSSSTSSTPSPTNRSPALSSSTPKTKSTFPLLGLAVVAEQQHQQQQQHQQRRFR
eukprot:TRINITY_DN66078_c3_g6_i1.p1 TRINITY_DN66078_c3_g6~~TRINITY_DN66078_c3_g6_i1.p1  ORF type:complete len:306 (+),score=137.99 TRINITY_DN66078_c3_g6_i1:85-1002(+)